MSPHFRKIVGNFSDPELVSKDWQWHGNVNSQVILTDHYKRLILPDWETSTPSRTIATEILNALWQAHELAHSMTPSSLSRFIRCTLQIRLLYYSICLVIWDTLIQASSESWSYAYSAGLDVNQAGHPTVPSDTYCSGTLTLLRRCYTSIR